MQELSAEAWSDMTQDFLHELASAGRDNDVVSEVKAAVSGCADHY